MKTRSERKSRRRFYQITYTRRMATAQVCLCWLPLFFLPYPLFRPQRRPRFLISPLRIFRQIAFRLHCVFASCFAWKENLALVSANQDTRYPSKSLTTRLVIGHVASDSHKKRSVVYTVGILFPVMKCSTTATTTRGTHVITLATTKQRVQSLPMQLINHDLYTQQTRYLYDTHMLSKR